MSKQDLFLTDLSNSNLSDFDLILKYLHSSEVWYFREKIVNTGNSHGTIVDTFHRVVSESFHISFKNITIVGSGKTGFSLSPYKSLREFDADRESPSDLDVAIISSDFFTKYWALMRAHTSLTLTRYFDEFSRSVYKGFIPKRALEEIQEIRREFSKSSDIANKRLQGELGIEHKINFRIYRSWDDLENYHLNGIGKIRRQHSA